MTTYLTIITTILVLTQIIRVTQNAMQLKKYQETNAKNKEILFMWEGIAMQVEDICRNVNIITDMSKEAKE